MVKSAYDLNKEEEREAKRKAKQEMNQDLYEDSENGDVYDSEEEYSSDEENLQSDNDSNEAAAGSRKQRQTDEN